MRYYYNILEEGNGVTITFPNIPECITCGETIDEALSHIKDALENALEFYTECNKPIPEQKIITENFIQL